MFSCNSRQRFSSSLGILGVILLASGFANPQLQAQSPPHSIAETPQYAPGQLLVLLADHADTPGPGEVVDAHRQGAPLPGALDIGQPKNVRFVISRRIEGETLEVLRAEPDNPRALLQRYLVFEYSESADLDAILATLKANPNVLHAHRSRVFYLSSQPTNPSDPLFPIQGGPEDHQWGLHALNLPAAWSYTKGHGYVGIIDSGLDVDHEDLASFDTAGHYIGGNFRAHLSHDFGDTPRDDDVDEMEGANVAWAGHGTHVAGIIGANTDNGRGTAGVCWHCSLLMEKVVDENKSFAFEPEVVDAYAQLLDYGAQVVNMSFGFLAPADCSNSQLDAFCLQLDDGESRDVVSFAAAGNYLADLQFPASDTRTISVGGLEPSLNFWDFRDGDPRSCPYSGLAECGSNWTQSGNVALQDFVAPAVDVLSTFYVGAEWNPTVGCVDNPNPGNPDPNPGYGLCTGTSMATPHGTGLGGLLRSVNPLLDKEEIRDVINGNADRANAWDPQFGHGLPDAAASVETILGQVGGTVAENRLTPLFELSSVIAGDYAYTTVPQYAAALTWAPEGYSLNPFFAPKTRGYGPFFPGGQGCAVGPCAYQPRAHVYLFATDRSPNGHPLVPLYRLSFDDAYGDNPDDRDHTYTTEAAGIESFREVGYRLDGVEGYLYERCSPEPSCIPAGAVRLYRLYNAQRDDWAILPESRLADFQALGFTTQDCCNDWIGYVYENVDSDLDDLIDGFETLLGTDPTASDSDCDGVSDGVELPVADLPLSDPLEGPCAATGIHIFDSFDTLAGPLDGRATELGGVTWTGRPGALVDSGHAVDAIARGRLPFDPAELGGSPVVEVSADLNANSFGWTAIGFTGQQGLSFLSPDSLWVLVRPEGYRVRSAGQLLAAGTYPGPPVGGYYRVDLRYDIGTHQATVTVGGTQVFSQTISSAQIIQEVGFEMFKAAENANQLDNFEVKNVTSQPTVLIADSFNGSGPLDGRPTEVGNLPWRALAGTVIQSNRVMDSAGIGGVPFDLSGFGPGIATVRAKINPVHSDWIAVGFGRQPDEPFWSVGELWASLDPTGRYVLWANGTQQTTGYIANPSGFHDLEVSYDTASGQAELSIDGVRFFSQPLTTAPDLSYAAFHILASTGNGARVNDFEARFLPSP